LLASLVNCPTRATSRISKLDAACSETRATWSWRISGGTLPSDRSAATLNTSARESRALSVTFRASVSRWL
jgi:hypothetical protein